MLFRSYRKENFQPECNPSFQSLHCIAHLDQDIIDVLPYLNSVIDGFEYFKDPPAVTFKIQGKIITVHPSEIAVNALRDEEESDKILAWLKREINDAWKKRGEITPGKEGAPKPWVLEILKLLHKTNCRKYGKPTCMVFATLVAQEAKGPGGCPTLDDKKRETLSEYMDQFQFDA